MKAYIVDPLAMLGLKMGYQRPLDRHDFPHGAFPGDPAYMLPGVGELKRHANLSGMIGPVGMAVDTYGSTTTQQHPLGTVATDRCGRIYRYTQVGGVSSAAGKLYQMAAPIPDHLALTAVAEAIGAGGAGDPVIVTPGATAGAANLYAEGILGISDGVGQGYSYRISGHAAITASVAFNLYLDPDERIAVALDSTSRYGLYHNVWKNSILCPTAVTGRVNGVAASVIANGSYGWFQTRGPAAVLINGTPAITSPVANSATTTGAVDVWTTAAAAVTITPVGYMMQVGVSTDYGQVYLTID